MALQNHPKSKYICVQISKNMYLNRKQPASKSVYLKGQNGASLGSVKDDVLHKLIKVTQNISIYDLQRKKKKKKIVLTDGKPQKQYTISFFKQIIQHNIETP